MKVFIDYREKSLIDCYGDECDTECLAIGDIQLREDDMNILIIERKTISDLKSSLKDGRFSEQKARILSSDFLKKIYIFEGHVDDDFKNIYDQICIRLLLKYNIFVIHSDSVSHTAKLIKTLLDKCVKDKSYFETGTTEINYIDTVKIQKKSNLTKENCFILQLAQIPLVSKKLATTIANHYTTFTELIEVLDGNIDEFQAKIKNDNVKIGKKTIQTLLDYLK